MSDMRQFIQSLPDASEPDAAKRAANEREISRRVGGLSPAERAAFESELRAAVAEMDSRMTFNQKWAAAARSRRAAGRE